MDYKIFSKSELTGILDIIQSALACKSEADVKILLERAKELVCGDYSICGLGAYNDNGLADAKKIINGSYPEGWFEVYNKKRLYEIDPVIWHHYRFFETQAWLDTYKKYGNNLSPEFIYDAAGFGLNYGISSSIKSPSPRLASIITFASSKNYFKKHQKAVMDILTPHFHQAIIRVCRENKNKALPHLTPRETEIIKWAKEGKTNWEISIILNISERAVKFHVENIEKKLDVVNKAHAVAVAMEQGAVD